MRCTALLVVAQAWLIADSVSGGGHPSQGLAQLRVPVLPLLARCPRAGAVGWLSSGWPTAPRPGPSRTCAGALVERVGRLGPGRDGPRAGRRLAVLATSGIDALDGYFARYLPQVFLAVIVPVAVIVVVAGADWISALIIAVTVPLIPIFMALVGSATRERMARQAGRSSAWPGTSSTWWPACPPSRSSVGPRPRPRPSPRSPTSTARPPWPRCKVAFLSSLILELLATISVALVAVAVGLRLLGGHLDLATALFVLILAPEAYLPAAAARDQLPRQRRGDEGGRGRLRVLEQPLAARGTEPTARRRRPFALRVDGLEVTLPRPVGAGPDDLPALTVEPGQVVALAGPERLRQVDAA